jgi:serine/threonine protein kinase
VSSPATDEFSPGLSVGPYTLESPVGEGGMAQVYRARDADGRNVAIKFLRRELASDETYRRRFVHEARSATELRHRHLVPMLEVGEYDGMPYLVMPYYPGGTLTDRIAAEPVPIANAVRWLAQLASGIDALHAGGAVHRDLKPSNVLLDAEGSAHVADFGLAKRANYTALTQIGQKLGTFAYMAPEVISGQPASPLSDIYALGCIAYEMFAGEPPFSGRALFQLALAHLNEDPRPVIELRSEIGRDLNWAILSALAKEPDQRPPTATAYANIVAVGARGSL